MSIESNNESEKKVGRTLKRAAQIFFFLLIGFAFATNLLWPFGVAVIYGGNIVINENLVDESEGGRWTVVAHFETVYLLNKNGQYKLIGDDLREFLGLKNTVLDIQDSNPMGSPITVHETVCYWWVDWSWKSADVSTLPINAREAKLVRLGHESGPYLHNPGIVSNPSVYAISRIGLVEKKVPREVHLIDHYFPETSPGVTHRTEIEALFQRLETEASSSGTKQAENSEERPTFSIVFATALHSLMMRVKELGTKIGATDREINKVCDIAYEEAIRCGFFLTDELNTQLLQYAISSRGKKPNSKAGN